MKIYTLPTKRESAEINMRDDLLLLNQSAQLGVAFFRHYEWAERTFTYGRFQKEAEVRLVVPSEYKICQRPTGGGLVDHENDWTYSIIIPSAHPSYRKRAVEHYKEIHLSIITAMDALGKAVSLYEAECAACSKREFSICFNRPMKYDVVCKNTGKKIAGAAQKRSRDGILTQGSIDKSILPESHWLLFRKLFQESLSVQLGVEVCAIHWDFLEKPNFKTATREE